MRTTGLSMLLAPNFLLLDYYLAAVLTQCSVLFLLRNLKFVQYQSRKVALNRQFPF